MCDQETSKYILLRCEVRHNQHSPDHTTSVNYWKNSAVVALEYKEYNESSECDKKYFESNSELDVESTKISK